MKHSKEILAIVALFISFHSNAQIVLSGYKCKFYKDQWPYKMAEMYSKSDTFRLTFFMRDIWSQMAFDNIDPKLEQLVGLKLCFDEDRYTMTKDSIYISTGKYSGMDAYYYRVYEPHYAVSVSLRSSKNDSRFSEKSKWLLSQIRQHKNGFVYLLNEKGQTCQNPYNPED